MKRLFGYFLQGALLIVPLAITLYVFYISFSFIDKLVPFNIPGLGFLVIIVGVTLVGILGKFFITEPIFSFIAKLLDRAPLVNVVYKSVKDLLSAFVGQEKKFGKPALVKLNKEMDIERIGFITQTSLTEIGIEKDKIAVYLPSSYGVLGELYIVPAKNVTPIDINSTEIMKFIVSGGVSLS